MRVALALGALLLACAAPAAAQQTTPAPWEALACLTPGHVVRLHFTGPDSAPQLKMLAAPKRMRQLRGAVERFDEDLRLPCLPAGDTVTTQQLYLRSD